MEVVCYKSYGLYWATGTAPNKWMMVISYLWTDANRKHGSELSLSCPHHMIITNTSLLPVAFILILKGNINLLRITHDRYSCMLHSFSWSEKMQIVCISVIT